MPEVGSVSPRGNSTPIDPTQPGSKLVAQPRGTTVPHASPDAPIGQPGPLGQPTGMPAPQVPGQTQILPDVLIGRDHSQRAAAERLRESGGASATETLLGLNLQPSVIGAFAAPPGNLEALRHMSPTTRRSIMIALLHRQRARMRQLARVLGREERDRDGQHEQHENDDDPHSFSEVLPPETVYIDDQQRERASTELVRAVRMLDLLDELLAMQDYTLGQMGSFSHG